MVTSLPLIPAHIAIIMDGNGRWAQKKGYPRFFGHVRGARQVRTIVEESARMGVKALTLYAFSSENWSRPENEKKVLWKLLKRYLLKEWPLLHEQNIKLNIIGEKNKLDHQLIHLMDDILLKLSSNSGMQLNLAISYGSRNELIQAAQAIAQDCVSGKLTPTQINEEKFEEKLSTHFLKEFSDVDLVIRTSGEKRISNFLLWQAAYAEFVFVDKYWPEFNAQDLNEAIGEYQKRERRFGRTEGVQK